MQLLVSEMYVFCMLIQHVFIYIFIHWNVYNLHNNYYARLILIFILPDADCSTFLNVDISFNYFNLM